jgi:CubicO group peptidase (beta-lactamase class C family)
MNDIPGIRSLPLLLLAFTLPIAPAAAQRADEPIVKGELGGKLDSYMTRLSAFGMSGSLLVAKGGEVILDKGYGIANRTTGAPVERSTPFMIGSLSKQFTAAAILKLEMQGKLSTSDKLARFFPNAPKDKREITIHQLLTHTAGLPYLSKNMFAVKSRAQSLKEMLELPLQSPPGSGYAYSSPGYTILAGIIEKASGTTFENYLTSNIFLPAGMTGTGFVGDSARWKGTTIHSYSGATDEGGLLDFPATEDMVGAGSIVTTPTELYKWEVALAGTKILSDAARKKFFSRQVSTDGQGGYSYGWNITRTIRGTTLIFHPGDIGGYNAEYRRYVDEGLVVIFTSNARVNGAGYRQGVMNPISLLIAGKEIPEPPATAEAPASTLASYAGNYLLPSGGTLRARAEDGRIVVGAGDQEGISALTGATGKDSASQAFLTARTVAIARGVAAGNFDELAGSLHPSLPLDGVRTGLMSEWLAYRDSLGEFRGVEPIGTALLSPTAAKSYYRLRFERGDVIGMYGWMAGKVMAIERGLKGAAVTEFVPESESTLASFDLFTGRMNRIAFTAGPDGAVAELTLTSPAGSVHARRDAKF